MAEKVASRRDGLENILTVYKWYKDFARILHEGGRKMMNIYCYYNQPQLNKRA